MIRADLQPVACSGTDWGRCVAAACPNLTARPANMPETMSPLT
jgi:hypothetical protein